MGRFADGDGINMALEIGSMPDYHMDVVVSVPTHHGSQSTRNLISRPEAILVNKNGKRFMAEVMEHFAGNAILNQPDALAYAVFDSDSLEHFMHTLDPLSKAPSNAVIERQLAEQIQARERLAEENTFAPNTLGASRVADTLEDIAAFIGADPTVFKTEIKRFNAFCDKGRDEDFFKEPKYLRPIRKPPFYAMRGNLFWQCTRGGIVINENMEVISKKGTAIKGLYATGDHASGWFSEYGYLGSTSLAWALISAYIAAELSCEYVRRNC